VSTESRGIVVRVKFASRRQLKQAFHRDLVRSVLFVRTDNPLPRGERVQVVLELSNGEQIQLVGDVIQVDTMQPVGMVVHLLDFTPEKRAIIEELLARTKTNLPTSAPTEQLPALKSAPQLPVSAMDVLVRGLRRLVWLCGDAAALSEVDYYQILGLPATANANEIREACSILRVLLDPSAPPEGLVDLLSDAQRARVGALYALVLEIERTLTNPARRSEYDQAVFSVVR
jgi:Tfp pilus assembly protein PilZ